MKSPSKQTKSGKSQKQSDELYEAMKAKDLPKVEALLAAGCEPDTNTLVSAIGKDRSYDVLRVLARACPKGQIDKMNFRYQTPLESAVSNNDAAAIQILLEAGADPNGDTAMGKALQMAAVKRYVEAITALVKGGADVNCRSKYGDTPLMSAARCDYADMVQLLLDAGADPALKGPTGMTAHDHAVKHKADSAIELFESRLR
jgi:hypothetical protein